jgi:hypothetical protein
MASVSHVNARAQDPQDPQDVLAILKPSDINHKATGPTATPADISCFPSDG